MVFDLIKSDSGAEFRRWLESKNVKNVVVYDISKLVFKMRSTSSIGGREVHKTEHWVNLDVAIWEARALSCFTSLMVIQSLTYGFAISKSAEISEWKKFGDVTIVEDMNHSKGYYAIERELVINNNLDEMIKWIGANPGHWRRFWGVGENDDTLTCLKKCMRHASRGSWLFAAWVISGFAEPSEAAAAIKKLSEPQMTQSMAIIERWQLKNKFTVDGKKDGALKCL